MSNNYKTIWEKCLVFIQDNLNNISRFKTWFEPIKPLKLEGNILTIQVPSVFFYEWLEENYCELLKKAITKELGTQGGIEYSVIVDKSEYGSTPSIVNLPSANKPAIHNKPIDMPISQNQDIPNPFVIPGLKKLKINSQLIDTYSFDNFIEGDCNRLARSA